MSDQISNVGSKGYCLMFAIIFFLLFIILWAFLYYNGANAPATVIK